MKKSILVVDDDPAVVDVVQGWLKIHGYDVCTALNGTEGLRKCRFRKPDAVILDIIMPDISGTRVAEEIRDDPATGSIPIIFLTGAIRSCDGRPIFSGQTLSGCGTSEGGATGADGPVSHGEALPEFVFPASASDPASSILLFVSAIK